MAVRRASGVKVLAVAAAAMTLMLPAEVAATAGSPDSTVGASTTTGDSNPGREAESDGVRWLCRPGQRPDPCRGSLATTRFSTDGTATERTPSPRHRRFDCFYVYPTVSAQPGVLADLSVDPEQVSIAQYQAARFSGQCRVFAPVYRQVTLSGLATATPTDWTTAYNSMARAWRKYLRRDNHGRGFVLIGHSQGASLLRHLLKEEIEPKRALRRRLIVAVLAGAPVSVRKGTVSGGDFRRLPGCTQPGQQRCIVSYATYGSAPPSDALFGVLRPDSGQQAGSGYEALCTNPAALSGGSAVLHTLTRNWPIAGPLGAAQYIMYGGPPPTASTPWLVPADRYRARCEQTGGAHVLMARPLRGAQVLNPSPTPAWGLHLMDINLPLGDLMRLVRSAARKHRD